MFHKITAAAPIGELRLLVHFMDGTAKVCDLSELCRTNTAFAPLADIPGLFACASVDVGGYGLSWNDEIDIACDALYAMGTPADSPFAGLLSLADATAIWGLSESALRKAIAYRKLVDGTDVLKFGKQWVVTRAAMEREYGPRP